VSLAGKRVLAIDDDPEVLHALGEYLRLEDAIGIEAHDLLSAQRILRELDVTPDVIVSDYRIGPDIDGIAAIAALRSELGARIPALVVTGDSSPSILQRIADAGLPVLSKPIRPEVMRLALGALLSGDRGR
jgi:CheY-like chemotaxis protein